MEVRQMKLLDFFEEPSVRLEIPPYQRVYSWTPRQCFELWLDIMRAARDEREHFSGIVIMTQEPGDATPERLSIVDGQQRLTTTTLLLVALARFLERTAAESGESSRPSAGNPCEAPESRLPAGKPHESPEVSRHPAGADAYQLPDPATIRQALLRGKDAEGPFRKLHLSRNDDATMEAVINDTPLPEEPSKHIVGNLAFLAEQMEQPDFDPAALWSGLKRLAVIACFEDDPDYAQEVFESANSKGLPLTLADMVRNYLLLEEEPDEQERLYDEYWAEAASLFEPDPGSRRLNAAITAWVCIRFRARRVGNAEYVYSTFKRYVADEFGGTRESVLLELRAFCYMWREQYRYHAIRKYLSKPWAINGAATLTQRFRRQKAVNQEYAERLWRKFDAADDKW